MTTKRMHSNQARVMISPLSGSTLALFPVMFKYVYAKAMKAITFEVPVLSEVWMC